MQIDLDRARHYFEECENDHNLSRAASNAVRERRQSLQDARWELERYASSEFAVSRSAAGAVVAERTVARLEQAVADASQALADAEARYEARSERSAHSGCLWGRVRDHLRENVPLTRLPIELREEMSR